MIEDSPINIESISKIIPVIAFDTRYNKDTKVNIDVIVGMIFTKH